MAWFVAVIDGQRGALFPWVPVCLAIGIGAYFGLSREPTVLQWGLVGGVLAVLSVACLLTGLWRYPLLAAMALLVGGFALAGARTQLVAEPVLGFRYYGSVEGRIVAIDRSVSDRVRLTLDRVVLEDVAPVRTPARVRISLHSDIAGTAPSPGMRIAVTAHLSPPDGPVEPGGFDFQRLAWFQRLGGVGYSRVPLMALERAPPGLTIARIRARISAAVQAELPGEVGAFAAAITTGDRSGMAKRTLADLRFSNLAHLLAISGLHMGLLTAFVFAVLRLGLVLVPGVGLTWPVKKIAAVGALLAGAAYLALSGGNVATQRAFVMVAVMLLAVLLERRALTLRAVAVAAVIVLLRRPESLAEPGFQMSFAATIALVAVFRALRGMNDDWVPNLLRPVLALVISSAVAGAATAPVAAAHFNMIAHYGLIANLLSVPLMGTVVMPGAVLAACLAPFGLQWIGLSVMEPAIRWIMAVAHWTAAQDGAVGRVMTPGPAVIPLFALGMLWLVLWQGRARLVGIAPAALAFVLWGMAERPVLLVSGSGGLIGVMTDAGRVLNKPRGDGFIAQSWLENDGDAADQVGAAARPGMVAKSGLLSFRIGDAEVVHLSGRGAAKRLDDGCAAASLVILAAVSEGPVPPGCRLLDRRALSLSGGLALRRGADGWQMVSARDRAGNRRWNSQ